MLVQFRYNNMIFVILNIGVRSQVKNYNILIELYISFLTRQKYQIYAKTLSLMGKFASHV